MSDPKLATPEHPIHALVAERFSPYAYADRPVSSEDLRSLFEAARWAPSSYNEQPWRYLVARQEDGERYEKLLSCLVEPNQAWAKAAPVLAIGIVQRRFARNDKPNPAAEHDLGLASATLTLEATARGLAVHQMIGILPDRVRELFALPDDADALTGLAIGYRAAADDAPEPFAERDLAPRTRRAVGEFVFGDRFGDAAELG